MTHEPTSLYELHQHYSHLFFLSLLIGLIFASLVRLLHAILPRSSFNQLYKQPVRTTLSFIKTLLIKIFSAIVSIPSWIGGCIANAVPKRGETLWGASVRQSNQLSDMLRNLTSMSYSATIIFCSWVAERAANTKPGKNDFFLRKFLHDFLDLSDIFKESSAPVEASAFNTNTANETTTDNVPLETDHTLQQELGLAQ